MLRQPTFGRKMSDRMTKHPIVEPPPKKSNSAVWAILIGVILLFISLGDCTHFFFADGYDGSFTTFCGGGCCLIILGLIWALKEDAEHKAKLEKMSDEEKRKKESELGNQLIISFLILIFSIFFFPWIFGVLL